MHCRQQNGCWHAVWVTQKHCAGACALALHPCSGEDLSGRELAVHRRDSDAAQARHLLLELGSAPGLPVVIELVEEALRPLVYQPHPVRADLQIIAQGLNRCDFCCACVCQQSYDRNKLDMLAGCGGAKAGSCGTAGDDLIPFGSAFCEQRDGAQCMPGGISGQRRPAAS